MNAPDLHGLAADEHFITNRTFDEMPVGARASLTRTLTRTTS